MPSHYIKVSCWNYIAFTATFVELIWKKKKKTYYKIICVLFCLQPKNKELSAFGLVCTTNEWKRQGGEPLPCQKAKIATLSSLKLWIWWQNKKLLHLPVIKVFAHLLYELLLLRSQRRWSVTMQWWEQWAPKLLRKQDLLWLCLLWGDDIPPDFSLVIGKIPCHL